LRGERNLLSITVVNQIYSINRKEALKMAKYDDFDLDIVVKKQDNSVQPNITSKSLCTPGCITGVLMCVTQSCVSCNSCVRC
jgi:lantibiotic bacteriocin